LPDFTELKPVKQGHAFQIDLSITKLPEFDFGLVFNSFIKIEKKGEYTFYSKSNDGSQLFINNKMIIDNNGKHITMDRNGKVTLDPGKHSIKVIYFQAGGGKVLNVEYEGPGIERKVIPGSVLFLSNHSNKE